LIKCYYNKMRNKIVYWCFLCFFFLGLAIFYSYKLTQIPTGINIDESSIGYNANLIARTLRDENNRFLPAFFLTLEGKDWKQPVRVYSTAILFKLFGASYFGLRFVSVMFALVSCFVFYQILRLLLPENLSFIGLLLFVSSPSLLIQSHLALENIDLLPFILAWLYFLFSWTLQPKNSKLVLAGILLGLSFYSYKGMRAAVPVYMGLSLLYFGYWVFIKKVGSIKSIAWFLFGIAPFLLPIKWLQLHYAGAIYDPAVVSMPSFHDALINYLSSFDFSFLFGKGDKMLVHSTGRQGMFLAPSLILFFLGIIQMAKEKKPWFYLAFFALVFTPVLFGSVNSVYRASRLMPYIPFATIIFTLGVKKILEVKTKVLKYLAVGFFVFSLIFSYIDFVKCYFGEYPKWISGDFSPDFNSAVGQLAVIASRGNKRAYFDKNDFLAHRSDLEFFREVYFPQGVGLWTREKENFPENGLVLTSVDGTGDLQSYREVPALHSGQKTLFIVGRKK
jgi:hypothetical protein